MFIQLAPMEGVVDWVLREMLSEVGGIDRLVTEFVRVTDRLLPAHVFERYSPELLQGGRTRAGTPVFIQLLGGEPGPMAENAARVAELGAPGIDLNFGCPAKSVNRHDGGAALLKIPSRLYDVTRAVRRALPGHIPVTTKVRLGFDHKEFHRDIGAAVDAAGAAQVVVHARTKVEMYTPPAHWEYIASMRVGRTLRFVANGEIWNPDDYQRCAEVSGVPDVALGRGLVARPTLAHAIRGHSTGFTFDRREFLNTFIHRNIEWRGPSFALARTKQILRYWSREGPELSRWFDQVKLMQTLPQLQAFLAELAKVQHPLLE